MTSRRVRTITLGAALLGALSLVLAALALREPILEQWWRWKLHSAEIEESRAAARNLVAIARKRASEGLEREEHPALLAWLLRLESWLRNAGTSEVEIAYLIGECHLGLGDYENALSRYQSVLDVWADDEFGAAAMKRIDAIGRALLRGEARLGPDAPPAASRELGVDLLVGPDGLLTRYPYFATADRTLMEIAEFYLEEGRYGAARNVYVHSFQYTREAGHEKALFEAARSYYERVGGARAAPAQLRQARARFELYRSFHASGARIDAVRRYLEEIEEAESAWPAVPEVELNR